VSSASSLTIGIDAANLRRGGGETHLVELLRSADPAAFGIGRVIVWGRKAILAALDDNPWLDKRNPPELEKGLLQRSLWQRYHLSAAARAAGCSVLFVPGGSYAGDFRPTITMCRNMLPFELHELKRYGCSLLTLKLLLLRFIQSRSFRNVDGLIFLTKYARRVVLRVTGPLNTKTTIIPHGLNARFKRVPKVQRAITDYDDAKPLRVLYVSIIDQYKHQWHVVDAIAALRKEGFPVVLDLVGPAYSRSLSRLNASIARQGVDHSWVRYHGAIPFTDLHTYYRKADLGLFASSCENMPNILLETMASGLPIACSNRGPMPEVLGAGGVYFDPEQPSEIANALRRLISSPQLRAQMAEKSYQKTQGYTWKSCASETFQFLVECSKKGFENV
jgi:glycosyltransferase involved in cell wall biosynthesis